MAEASSDEFSGITIRDFFRFLATHKEGAKARKVYCQAIADDLGNLASWLALDAFLGAGDSRESSSEQPAIEPERRRAFIGAAIVAQMSAELVKGSTTLLGEGNEYGSAGLVRQLIECEYLFRAFQIDFTDAAKWLDAPATGRNDFSPANLRRIGGFDREEYSNHCEAGGHPRVGGRHLLDFERHLADLVNRQSRQRAEVNDMLWMDLALHCERTWRALTQLLAQEHARFDAAPRVAAAIERSDAAYAKWMKKDVLAHEIGPILGFLAADPDTPMSDLLNREDATDS